MARTITDIQTSITSFYVAEMAAIGVTVTPATWSAVNLQRLIIYTISSAAFVLESLFDLLRSDVETMLKEQTPHTLRWYASKAKLYQHGQDLIPESDQYDNTGLTDADIDQKRVVKYSAVVEQVNEFGRVSLRIKLATATDDDLAPLSSEQLAGVTEYFARVKDAGVALRVESLPADYLKLSLELRYNPLILDGNGARLDGTDSEPVPNAIKEYLKNLPFNGQFVLAYLTDAIQAVDGVVIPTLTAATTKYGDRPYEAVNVKYLPDAGYLRIYADTDLTITYIPESAIQ